MHVSLSSDFLILILAASPALECRVAIPFGLYSGVHPVKVFALALSGNLIPAASLPLLLPFLERKFLKNTPLISTLCRLRNRALPYVSKYGLLGLTLFVSVPLPISGAWTASVAAFLLGFQAKKAIASISLGVLVACAIVELMALSIQL